MTEYLRVAQLSQLILPRAAGVTDIQTCVRATFLNLEATAMRQSAFITILAYCILVLVATVPLYSQDTPDSVCLCNSPTNYIAHCVNYNPSCEDYQTYKERGPNNCSCQAWGPADPKPLCCRIPEDTLVIEGFCDIAGPDGSAVSRIPLKRSVPANQK
jgi:hypothetical protein